MKQIIVTVGREHGSGGKYIAEQIAKQLGIAFYDKELLLTSVFNAEDAALCWLCSRPGAFRRRRKN